ncbi:MAG: sugar transferase [Planctomycetota bacterium]
MLLKDGPTGTLPRKAPGRGLLSRLRRPSIEVDIPSRHEVRRRIHRDRLLADRAGRRFVIVLFATPGHAGAVTLAQAIKSRKRETDEFGPAPREVCGKISTAARHCYVAILPETTREGGMAFAKAVLARLPEHQRPQWSVTAYPDASADLYPSEELRDAPAGDTVDVTDGSESGTNATASFHTGLPVWKRSLDVAVAGTALFVLSPLLLLVGLLVKLDSKGPALFWQKRTGLGGRVFWIAKVRTMVVDAERVMKEMNLRDGSEQDGPAFKLRHDPRVTRLGRLLRQTSIDELPQLWNILRGDMTLVGPRPLPVSESDACLPWQRRRLDVTPGLTCIWQVHGRSRVLFDDWMRMDIKYVSESRGLIGLLRDASLLVKTVPAVFLKRGF